MGMGGTGAMAAEPDAVASPALAALAALTRRLLEDVHRKSGIRHDAPLERKLCRILASMPLDLLEAWVRTVEEAAADSPDWLSLIENLTVHETYFFRDLPHHEHLRRVVFPLLIDDRRAAGGRTVKVWSAGCSSGEEAYSLAIVLLEALADQGEARRTPDAIETAWTIDVLGTDISRPVLRQARNAAYGGEGLSAFRDLPRAYAGWFIPLQDAAGDWRRVRPDARGAVRFLRHNLMEPAPPETGFDLVSCRNVTIYFDSPARAAAQALLTRALRPGGVMVLGTTDRPTEPARFDRIRGDRAVAYRLRSAP